MIKNKFIQSLIDMQKRGIQVYLTEAGVAEFMRLIKTEFNPEQKEQISQVG